MPTVSPQPVPPTAEQLRDRVRANLPVQSPARRYAFFALIGLLLGSLLLGSIQPGLQAVLLLAALSLVIWMFIQRRAAEQVQRQIQQLHELVVLRHDAPAATLAWSLIPKVRHLPDAHVQTVMLLAVSCARLDAYDAALAAHHYLLEHIPSRHPTSLLIRLQQVMAMLHEDHLVDADAEIRRLSHADLPGTGHAMLQLAMLYQQIKTHHHADAVTQADAVAPSLQPLGIEAGYGYAMLATAFHHTRQPQPASNWWHQATLLMPPDVICHDIPETAVLLHLPAEPSLHDCMERDPS
ncbi:MAG: hypothetical protein ACYC26_00720 [Phycisphaerales bacterium]